MTSMKVRASWAAAMVTIIPALLAACGGGPSQYTAQSPSDYVQPSSDVLVNGAGQPVDSASGAIETGATRPER